MENNKYSILIVDDSDLFLRTIENIIRAAINCNIFKAKDSNEALMTLGNHEIDLILLDVNMPGRDGFATSKIINENPRTAKIPIIFITGFDPFEELKEKGFDLGAVDYLIKPFKDNELIKLIRLYLRFIEHERKSIDALYNLNKELSEEIQRRKKVEKALKNSEKELKETLKLKDRFFSIVAHDLKNPLSAFKELTKVIIEDYDNISSDEFFDLINELNESSQSVYRLLENLLDWSRSQLGSLQINPVEFDVRFVIKQSFDLLKLSADKKSIKLISEIEEPLMVVADVNMITTVFRNIISNSIKFTDKHGKIIVSAKQSNNDNDFIDISLKDNGIGMEKKMMEEIMKSDFHPTTLGTNNEMGTGLGLIICREFIDKNNGRMKIWSNKGQGTEFIISLKTSY